MLTSISTPGLLSSGFAPAPRETLPAARAGRHRWRELAAAVLRRFSSKHLAALMSDLKHGADGVLLRGPTGKLVRDCSSEPPCPCLSSIPCPNCPDVTPTQFQVSFVGVALCEDCVVCGEKGNSLKMAACSLDGTYLLTQNGNCAWTFDWSELHCSGTLFGSSDCSGDGETQLFSIQQVRLSATQFLLQVTNDSNTILVFNAVIEVPACCEGYTVANEQVNCECSVVDGVTFVALGWGGTATVTPC